MIQIEDLRQKYCFPWNHQQLIHALAGKFCTSNDHNQVPIQIEMGL